MAGQSKWSPVKYNKGLLNQKRGRSLFPLAKEMALLSVPFCRAVAARRSGVELPRLAPASASPPSSGEANLLKTPCEPHFSTEEESLANGQEMDYSSRVEGQRIEPAGAMREDSILEVGEEYVTGKGENCIAASPLRSLPAARSSTQPRGLGSILCFRTFADIPKFRFPTGDKCGAGQPVQNRASNKETAAKNDFAPLPRT